METNKEGEIDRQEGRYGDKHGGREIDRKTGTETNKKGER